MSESVRALVARASALVAALAVVPIVLVAAASPAQAADITTACAGTTSGTTFTLSADCNTSEPLTVPAGFTLNGAGRTLRATDQGRPQWNGAIVTNAAGGPMNIENLTIAGPANGFQLCTNANNVLYGIHFNDASGTVSNVTVEHIFQQQNGAFGSCQTGRAIRADGPSADRTVTITSTTVRDYQKSGFEARGSMTMDVSGSTAGPPHDLRGLIAQNAVTFVGAAGTVANNTIHGSGDEAAGPGGQADGTAVLLFGAHNATVTSNTITGAGTDIGVAVTAGSTDITISFNQIGRTAPDDPDPTGVGVRVGEESSAMLICNSFTNWNENIVGAIQIACTPLPEGAECQAYSAHAPAVEGGTAAFMWSVTSGSLPPGLAVAADGAITGTPTRAGSYDFTLQVTDAGGLTAAQGQTIKIAPDCPSASPTPTPSPTPSVPAPSVTPTPPATPPPSGAPAPGEEPTTEVLGEAAGPLPATGTTNQLMPTLALGSMLMAGGAALAALAGRRRNRGR